MVYQADLIDLDEEWRRISVPDEESFKIFRQIPGEVERKREEIISYGRRLMDSVIARGEKEARMRQVRENLRYLDGGEHEGTVGGSSQLVEGMLIGGLATFIGMYFMDKLGEYMKGEMSKGMMEGLYSGLEGKEFKPDLMK
jgi:hypothetical protein